MCVHCCFILTWYLRGKLVADKFILPLPEIPAIGIVDKGECPIRGKPADKLGLVFDNTPVPLFGLMQLALTFSELLVICP